jgi:hypothetical protein
MKRRNGAIAFGSVGGTLAPWPPFAPSRRVDDVEQDTLARRSRPPMPSQSANFVPL